MGENENDDDDGENAKATRARLDGKSQWGVKSDKERRVPYK